MRQYSNIFSSSLTKHIAMYRDSTVPHHFVLAVLSECNVFEDDGASSIGFSAALAFAPLVALKVLN